MKRRAGGSAFFFKVMNLDSMDSEISNLGGAWCVAASGHFTEVANPVTGITPESGATGVQEGVSAQLAASSPCRMLASTSALRRDGFLSFHRLEGEFLWFTTRTRPGAV